jgi:hypothetical protein
MNQAAEKTYRSGEEILEYYVPGYLPTSAAMDDDACDLRHTTTGEQMMEKLLSGLKSKLDNLQISKTGS